ncbi:MAG: threonine synthase [Selenomonadaceae bacterium]|nr:threonine synthase [Selenomonadaceae bacterium]
MNYTSTRSKDVKISSAEAIHQGLSIDGGLFVPESIPKVKLEEIGQLCSMTYVQRAVTVLKKFLTDYSDDELAESAELAYDWFDVTAKVPLIVLLRNKEDTKAPIGIMELWHGNTSAFKDLALQILPHLMSKALKKTGESKEILILVATSGDTGKAALAGFADVPQTKIMVFYPDGGVSKIQRLQMVTQTGKNVNVTAVRGNFDDCQNGVKNIFSDEEIRAKLSDTNVKLSSANSINWGRLVPQIVYYFSSYAEFINAGNIKLGDQVNVIVPTGNFGNILAAYYARKMGLPVKKLICASNINHVLTDFFQTGVYDRNREFHKTITPSMDILISSNLERLLYHETSGDVEQVKSYMKELSETGRYKIGATLKKRLDKIFYADYATEAETASIIQNVFSNFGYLVDTHTAVAMSVMAKYRRETKDMLPAIVASTASPFKFTAAVLNALGENVTGVDDLVQLGKLSRRTNKKIPKNLESLGTAKILHEDVCDKEEMAARVLKFAAE